MVLEFISDGPTVRESAAIDVEWGCDFAVRRAELYSMLEHLPRSLERATSGEAMSTIQNSVLTALRRYCALVRSERVPYPSNEKVLILRDSYALAFYLACLAMVQLGKVPDDEAVGRLTRLRIDLDRMLGA